MFCILPGLNPDLLEEHQQPQAQEDQGPRLHTAHWSACFPSSGPTPATPHTGLHVFPYLKSPGKAIITAWLTNRAGWHGVSIIATIHPTGTC